MRPLWPLKLAAHARAAYSLAVPRFSKPSTNFNTSFFAHVILKAKDQKAVSVTDHGAKSRGKLRRPQKR